MKIYEFYEDAENYYLILEYIDGKLLFDEIIERGPLPENLVANIM